MWREIHHFDYTGEPEPFTLSPGRYLLMCHGAHGGKSSSNTINYGGVAYGVLNLTETTTMYAVVGGNGEDGTKTNAGAGGFNGGGAGGGSYIKNYTCGSGGGGASDIRLTMDRDVITHTLPSEYTELTFIQTDTEHKGWINTEYVPHDAKTQLELSCELAKTSNETWNAAIASSNAWGFYTKINTGYYYGYCMDSVSLNDWESTNVVYEEPVVVRMNESGVYWYKDNQLMNSMEVSGGMTYSFPEPVRLFCYSRPNEGAIGWSPMKLFYFKIYEDNVVARSYVPCKNESGVCGLFELIEQKFYECPDGGTFIAGDEVPDDERTTEQSFGFNKPIYTRIIVAGGGGGGNCLGSNASYYNYSGFGGGAVGGFISCNDSIDRNEQYADQMNGYQFAIGEPAKKKTSGYNNGYEGAGGGGGGWYGGFAIQSNGAYSSGNGGGGSGYVLTESSYKPEGYDVPSEYYLTDTYMAGGHAIDPFVAICEPVDTVNAGDEVIFYPTGEPVSISLPPGTFVLKCWGGDGGCQRNLSQSSRGGYAEGTLQTHSPYRFHVYVGESGLYDSCLSNEYVHQIRPGINFNGGGFPSTYGVVSPNGHSGGGASDIRIGVDSPYARVIVAGGGGGMGYGVGGAGGGVTGVIGSGNYGTSPGPGTQTMTPVDPHYPVINGGFGYGGNAPEANGSGVGGAGGGGWYGGSGTYPTDTYDRHRGGSGGSGYVLTDDSYKPTDYVLDEEFHLTDTKLVQGGNNLPVGHTQIVIEVIDSSDLKILCRDSEGIKTFDRIQNQWVRTSVQTLSVSLFEQYGVMEIPNDVGLLDEFEILVWDPGDTANAIDINVVPNKQVVTCEKKTNMNVKKTYIDLAYDKNEYDIDLKVEKKSNGLSTKILTTVTMDKLTDSDSRPKIYYATYFSK